MNNMDDSMEADQPFGPVDRSPRIGVDRRTMLKAAVAAGTVAGVWVAPRIETLGFTPAAAAGTPCPVEDNGTVDINTNSGSSDCPLGGPNPQPLPHHCCGMSAGDNGKIEFWFFGTANGGTTPVIPGCQSITVQSITLDCSKTNKNPDVGQMGLAIVGTSGEAACSNCRIETIVYEGGGGKDANGHPIDVTVFATPINNPPAACTTNFPLDHVVDVSVPSCTLASHSRARVFLSCTIVSGGCTPTP